MTTSLAATPTPVPRGGIRYLIRSLGATDAFGNPAPDLTGRLTVTNDDDASEASIYLRAGKVYTAELSGYVPPVALRLLSGGHLSGATFKHLDTLAAEQVGPTAIAEQYVAPHVVEDIHRQMLLATLTHLYGWKNAHWVWEDHVTSDSFTVSGLETNLIITAADERIGQWETLARAYPEVTKGNAVPEPGPEWSAKAGESTTPEIASILQYIDGETTVAQIAAVCGFARFEIAGRLAKAIADGLLVVRDPEEMPIADDDEILIPAASGQDLRDLEVAEAQRQVEIARQALEEAEERLIAATNARSAAE